MWCLKLLLTGCLILVARSDDRQKEKQWLTWQQILGGDPPRSIEFDSAKSHGDNSIIQPQYSNRDYEYVDDVYNQEYDYDTNNYQDYDESFFKNFDYIYVDTEDENYTPPPKVEKENKGENQTADRRTLDFIYHLFNDQWKNDKHDGGLSLGNKKRRPSLIEAVFETIDNHIIEDLREWSSSAADTVAQAAKAVKNKPSKHSAEALVAPAIEAVSEDNDIVLITDEQGHQHVVTINDIVSSLSHLDERTLTNLLLNPSVDDSRSFHSKAQKDRSFSSKAQKGEVNPTSHIDFRSFKSKAQKEEVNPTSHIDFRSFNSKTQKEEVNPTSNLDIAETSNLDLGGTSNLDLGETSNLDLGETSNLDIAESEIIPVVLGTQDVGPGGLPILRPVRHTGPTTAPQEEEEVYVVRDENGAIQLVTLDNIISSLASLDDQSINSLLFGVPGASSQLAHSSPSVSVPSLNSITQRVSKPKITTTTEKPLPLRTTTTPLPILDDKQTESEPEKPSPVVSTDENGNLRVVAHPGSVTVDLKDLSWYTNNGNSEQELPELDKPEEPKKPAPVFIGGSRVETDKNGDIYITPDPNKPFTLDIHNILALAEQAENPSIPSNPQPSETETNPKEEEKPEEQPERGHEILSYLAGIEDFLPTAIVPKPIHPTVENTATQHDDGSAGVNTFRESLLQAVNQQRFQRQALTPQPVVQPLIQRFVQPVVQPIVQPIVHATPQSASQVLSSRGIGATLSNLLSNFVRPTATSQRIESVPQAPEKSPEQEYVKLVVRQQARNSLDKHFGEVNIPLPNPIHYQPTTAPPQPEESAESEISSTEDLPSPLQSLSSLIQRSLQLQANNVPRFIPPGARTAVSKEPVAIARSDTGPILRTDRKISSQNNKENSEPKAVPRANRKISLAEILKQRSNSGSVPRVDRKISNDGLSTQNIRSRLVSKPSQPVFQPVTTKPTVSITSVLQGLPPNVRESIRRQVQRSRPDLITEEETKPQEDPEEVDGSSEVPIDRSSYASPPEYNSGGGGYGYGPETYSDESDKSWLDIYLLADLTKVHKVGDVNLSVKSPIIGDPSYFVKTRGHGYYR